MGLNVEYVDNFASRAKIRIFSPEPRCIQSLAQLCDNGIGAEISDKAIVAEGRQLIIHFVGKQVPEWCLDKMKELVSAIDSIGMATVFNSKA